MTVLADNRVTAAIAAVQTRIDERLDDAGRASLDNEMAVTFEEHFRFQQLQASAHAAGTLATDEALIVYRALGEVGSPANGGWSAGTDLATKVAVTMLMSELLARSMRR